MNEYEGFTLFLKILTSHPCKESECDAKKVFSI